MDHMQQKAGGDVSWFTPIALELAFNIKAEKYEKLSPDWLIWNQHGNGGSDYVRTGFYQYWLNALIVGLCECVWCREGGTSPNLQCVGSDTWQKNGPNRI